MAGSSSSSAAVTSQLGSTGSQSASQVQASSSHRTPAEVQRRTDEQDCVDFLRHHMPPSDRQRSNPVMSDTLLRSNARLALQTRVANTWASAVPWSIFQGYVLPYASLDEPRDFDVWRPLFSALFAPLVSGSASLSEAAQIINRQIWALWGIVFLPDHTPEIMSPLQVIEAGYASCTGLSIFLVDALRSVGIPARVAGTPSWVGPPPGPAQQRADEQVGAAPGRFNNHNWVEVWNGDGTWSFTGAAEWDASGFNRSWFFPEPVKWQIPHNTMHAVYAASFAAESEGGMPYVPLVWNMKNHEVPGVDVTQSYLDAAARIDSLQEGQAGYTAAGRPGSAGQAQHK